MAAQLGLVCITDSDLIRFRNVTRQRLLQLPEAERGPFLAELFSDNLARLNRAIAFCRDQGIGLYRITSRLFPFADEPVGREVLLGMADELSRVGSFAREASIRLVLHPDQFVVINSDTPTVIANSIKILEMHALIFDLLDLPRSHWAAMNIHGGKGGRSERLIEVTRGLPENIRSRITFENDERAYSAAEILEVCRETGAPMIFDAHHHLVHEKLDSYEHPSIREMTLAARETWPQPEWQIVHISNGREHLCDARHSDLIHTMPSAFLDVPWIEVEAKGKERAIAPLLRGWANPI